MASRRCACVGLLAALASPAGCSAPPTAAIAIRTNATGIHSPSADDQSQESGCFGSSSSSGPRDVLLRLCAVNGGSSDGWSAAGSGAPPRAETRVADTLEAFERDVNRAQEQRSGPDMTIPSLFRGQPDSLFLSNIFTKDMWRRHTSCRRYIRYLRRAPVSRLLRRILPQLSVFIAWCAVAVLLESGTHPAVRRFRVPLAPLGLVSTFVAALTTMRSNQGLNRLAEARVAWGRVVILVRDTSQLLSTYVYPADEQLGLLAARHISMFGWLQKCFLRDENDGDVVSCMLPNAAESDFVLGSRKHAAASIARIRQILSSMHARGRIPPPAHQALELNLLELDRVVGMCERIKGSSIPPIYTAHASRLLVFYLFFLPLALHGTMNGSCMQTVVVSTAVGYAMLGLDEISHILEQPFNLMPLHQQSRNAMWDAAEAFVKRPPPLPRGSEESSHAEETNGEEGFSGYARRFDFEGIHGDMGADMDLLD